MRALVFRGVRDIRYEDVPKPECPSNGALVKVKAVGVCGSDVHGYLGITGRRLPPLIMGHEIAGVVEVIDGPGEGLQVGDRVAVFPYAHCGQCVYCRDDKINACLDKRFFGVLSTNGGMAEFVGVPRHVLFPLPKDATFAQGALVEPLSVAARTVAKIGGDSEGSTAIIGAGPIGLFCLVLMRAQGRRNIGVIDLSEPRLDLARDLGAEWTWNPRQGALSQLLEEITQGRGVATVIEAVGVEATLNQAIQLVIHGGKLVIVGMLERRIPVDMHALVSREIRVESSFLYGRVEFQGVLDQLISIQSELERIAGHIVPLGQGPEVFRALAAGEGQICKAVLVP
jgi:L-iditol 2-dehydrogenase